MTYRLTIWGARGSIPTPGPRTARYGGNTPCVAVESDTAGARGLVILDAGTGIRPLGSTLVERFRDPIEVDLLLSHTHWDHIQGLPFFAPLFDARSAVRIWGPRQGQVDLERILRQQMDPVVFPVPLDELDAALTVTHVEPGTFAVNGFRVETMRLRHPGTTLAYRLTAERGGPSLVYVTDNELGPGGRYDVGPTWHREFVAFARDADVLIHDAMYTPRELERYGGWGHSSHVEAVAFAAEADARKLVLFHHRPERLDAELDAVLADARACADAGPRDLEVVAAVEGAQLTL
jgi:phosphoribosyl 1,2-cyclic phosphodiesterase